MPALSCKRRLREQFCHFLPDSLFPANEHVGRFGVEFWILLLGDDVLTVDAQTLKAGIFPSFRPHNLSALIALW